MPSATQCDTKVGYDPLTELPDGQKKLVALGYERPQRGPTTNFVGNHMTQVQPTLLAREQQFSGWQTHLISHLLTHAEKEQLSAGRYRSGTDGA